MRRREFIALVGGATTAPLLSSASVARAQEQMRRIGVLMNAAATDPLPRSYLEAFKQGLQRLGWTEGRNIQLEVRWNGGDAKLAHTYAAELVGLKLDVILSASTNNLAILRQATKNIPIVFVQVSDPLAQGFVPNLAHPGGNITGFSNLEFSIGGKCVELIKKVVPGLTRVAVMYNPDTSPQSKYFLESIGTAARSLALEAIPKPVRSAADIEAAIADARPHSGLILPPDSFNQKNHTLIIEQTMRHRLPAVAMLAGTYFVRAGGLMAYAQTIGLVDQFGQSADYVDRILRGTKPGDLPVQLATDYRLFLNNRTAKALGLHFPPTLLFTADEVVE